MGKRSEKKEKYDVCFFILNIKVTITKLPATLPTNTTKLYNTTKTVPGGAIHHDYPLAFNMDLKKYIYLLNTRPNTQYICVTNVVRKQALA